MPTCYFIPSHHSLKKGYFTQLPAKIDSFKFSFFSSLIKIWNTLPSFITNSPSLDHFCNNLDNNIQCNTPVRYIVARHYPLRDRKPTKRFGFLSYTIKRCIASICFINRTCNDVQWLILEQFNCCKNHCNTCFCYT